MSATAPGKRLRVEQMYLGNSELGSLLRLAQQLVQLEQDARDLRAAWLLELRSCDDESHADLLARTRYLMA